MGNVVRIDFCGELRHVRSSHVVGTTMKYEYLSLDRLKELLNYDPDTGDLTWAQRPSHNSKRRIGDVAGTLKKKHNGRWYRTVTLDGREYQASQIAFFFHHGRWARGQVSQKNGDAADTSAENLIELRTTSEKHNMATKEGRLQYRRDYWTTNETFRRTFNLKRYYGLSFEEYQTLHDLQKGLCAICEKPETSKQGEKTKWLSVDHCHDTGNIRGLLCSKCNSGLGYFDDRLDLIEKAVTYRRDASTTFTAPMKRTA